MRAIEIDGLIFEWDNAKAATNIARHGISFYEAASAFGDDRAIILPDIAHSQDEDRFLLIGLTEERKLLMVVHVDRKETLRIISARHATPRERRDYEHSGF